MEKIYLTIWLNHLANIQSKKLKMQHFLIFRKLFSLENGNIQPLVIKNVKGINYINNNKLIL